MYKSQVQVYSDTQDTLARMHGAQVCEKLQNSMRFYKPRITFDDGQVLVDKTKAFYTKKGLLPSPPVTGGAADTTNQDESSPLDDDYEYLD